MGGGILKPGTPLYAAVYENLRSQILNQQRAFGSTLPFANQLAREYHVGIHTMKTVLNMLREDGLIRTEERRHAVVIYKAPFTEKDPGAIRLLLSRQKDILSAYQVIELLFPGMIALSLRSCRIYELENYETALKRAKRVNGISDWEICVDLVYEVICASGNRLFESLCSSLRIFGEVPFIMEYQRQITSYVPFVGNEHIGWLIDCLSSGPYATQKKLAAFYHSILLSVEKSFDLLRQLYPHLKEDKAGNFQWHIGSETEQLFKLVSRALITEMGTGTYPPGSLLPSEAKLAEMYDVSMTTIRRVMDRLRKAGFVRTENGVGSYVLQRSEKTSRGEVYAGYRKDLRIYLSSLQLMAIAVRPAALLTFEQLCRDRESISAKRLSEFTRAIIKRIPLQPLKVIMERTMWLLDRGFYYTFYSEDSGVSKHLDYLGRRLAEHLAEGDKAAFSDGMFEAYCYILDSLRDFLIKDGFSDAAQFFSPHQ